MKYLEWEAGGLTFLLVDGFVGLETYKGLTLFDRPKRRKSWRLSDQRWLDPQGSEAIAKLASYVPADEWQDGTDDMLTNVERVYETRIDCPAERLMAAGSRDRLGLRCRRSMVGVLAGRFMGRDSPGRCSSTLRSEQGVRPLGRFGARASLGTGIEITRLDVGAA